MCTHTYTHICILTYTYIYRKNVTQFLILNFTFVVVAVVKSPQAPEDDSQQR